MNKQELLDRLRHEDEVTLLELLDLHSDQIVDQFLELVEERLGVIERYYEV